MKPISFILGILLIAQSGFAIPLENTTKTVLSAKTTTGAGTSEVINGIYSTFQCIGTTSSGSGSATIAVEVTDLESPVAGTSVDWITAGTITLTLGVTQTGDGFATSAAWRHGRVKVTAISGTGASVSCYLGRAG